MVRKGVNLLGLKHPILQFLDGTIIVNQRLFKKIFEGYGFSASKRFESVASGDYVDVYFENPKDSGRRIFLAVLQIETFMQCHADIYLDVTKTVSGTKINVFNLNRGSEIESVANVEFGGTYSGGSRVLETVVPGGSHIRAIGGAIEVGETAILPSGHNMVARVTNASASASDFSVRFLWWEEII